MLLSFLISCMIFLLPLNKELESKVSLGVGAIFGAIGNRYFVDSALDGLRKNETSDEVFPSPKINEQTKTDDPIENSPRVNQPSPSVPSIEPGTEEAEVKPIGSN